MPTVMIVDDDPGLREALGLRLRQAGFDVVSADHPDRALGLVLKQRPDLILLDIEMPRFSGLDFHECLRCSDRARDIPVVYLSGRTSAPARRDAYRQGGRAFIAKPYEPGELIATITGVLEATHGHAPTVRERRTAEAAAG